MLIEAVDAPCSGNHQQHLDPLKGGHRRSVIAITDLLSGAVGQLGCAQANAAPHHILQGF